MRRALLAVVVVGAGACLASAQATSSALRGIDVYRSTQLTSAQAQQLFGDRMKKYVKLRGDHMPKTDALAEKLRLQMQDEVAALPGIAFVELHFSEHYTSEEHSTYAIFDIVDRTDIGRMAFTRAPAGHLPDPENLLLGWRRYMATGEALSMRGEMSYDRPNCAGFYCLWGGTPEIDALQGQFKIGADAHGDELRRVLKEDADGEKRADALFVLSYSTSGRDVTTLCHDALLDPDPRVRGAGLQIQADIANHHQDMPIALDRVLLRLDDPTAAVRGKAMGLLVALAERDAYREVMKTAAVRLITLLKLHQPESRDLAYTLLGLISQQTFDRADVVSWEAWARQATAAKR